MKTASKGGMLLIKEQGGGKNPFPNEVNRQNKRAPNAYAEVLQPPTVPTLTLMNKYIRNPGPGIQL